MQGGHEAQIRQSLRDLVEGGSDAGLRRVEIVRWALTGLGPITTVLPPTFFRMFPIRIAFSTCSLRTEGSVRLKLK